MIDPQLTNPVDHHIETAYPIDNPVGRSIFGDGHIDTTAYFTNPISGSHTDTAPQINNPISHQVSNTISDGMVDPKLINPVDHHIETAYPIDNPIGQDHIETAPLNIDPVTDGVSDMDVDDKAAQLEADITGYSYFGIEDDDTASHTIGRFSESRTGVEVDDESLEKNETLTAPQDIYHRVDGLLEVDVDTAPAQYPSSPSSYYTANDGSDDEVAA
ncbi:hypothetical protein GGS21DRAFT_522086 [Xylaria nigripes]|nr:hypothetical protein GGS21DRAFT_522086 [Xylaria nigripes]